MKMKLLKRIRAFVNGVASIDGWTIRCGTIVGVCVSYANGYKYISDLRKDYVLFSDENLVEKNIDDSLHLATQAYWENEGREYWRKKIKKK